MAQAGKINTREALDAEIRKLPAEQQISAAVIIGPGKFLEDTVASMGGAVKFTKQLMSHDANENEKAIAAMADTVKNLVALADTDKLKHIAAELMVKAKKP